MGALGKRKIGSGTGRILGVVAGVAAAAAGATLLTGAVLSRVFAVRALTPSRRPHEPLRLIAVADNAASVTLPLTRETVLPGQFSLGFDGGAGHARVSAVLEVGDNWVRRELVTVDRGELRPGIPVSLGSAWYWHPRELGYPCVDTVVQLPLGPAPAWSVPAAKDRGRYAIHVHGRGAHRRETIRGLPPFAKAGYHSMIVSYRNDGEAHPGAAARYALGAEEWRDVEAAIEVAVGRGAREIVLVGWSMGGTIALQTWRNSRFRDLIRGIALDSPALDWEELLRHQAGFYHLPDPVVESALGLMASGRVRSGSADGLDFAALNPIEWAEELTVPVLMQTSPGDTFVPDGPAVRFAAARPDLITHRRIENAEHVRVWNRDPAGWEDAVSQWLRDLPALRGWGS
ncbi:alpha/beta hydrolase family protein, partial [Leucobacter sp. M11]|uniref:alpha/beta hydrolase family protein n=1 Tax=Leucobacter sp. M11 TaxID=2993565 RepID=UPI002D80DBB3